jgi:hypothetical protein
MSEILVSEEVANVCKDAYSLRNTPFEESGPQRSVSTRKEAKTNAQACRLVSTCGSEGSSRSVSVGLDEAGLDMATEGFRRVQSEIEVPPRRRLSEWNRLNRHCVTLDPIAQARRTVTGSWQQQPIKHR